MATLSNNRFCSPADHAPGCCAVFVQDPVELEQTQMCSMRVGAWPRLGKLCFRRLSTLSVCRHIAVERAPRAPLSFGNRTYYNPSFSARPTLAAKIWYRKNGIPRSKWKGALFGDYNIHIIWILLTTLGSFFCLVRLCYIQRIFSECGRANCCVTHPATIRHRHIICGSFDAPRRNYTFS